MSFNSTLMSEFALGIIPMDRPRQRRLQLLPTRIADDAAMEQFSPVIIIFTNYYDETVSTALRL